jgi:hypothetical protein
VSGPWRKSSSSDEYTTKDATKTTLVLRGTTLGRYYGSHHVLSAEVQWADSLHPIAPHTMNPLSPLLYVVTMQSSWNSSPTRRHTNTRPSGSCRLYLLSSVYAIFFHSSSVQSRWAIAYSGCFFLLTLLMRGVLRAEHLCKSVSLIMLRTVEALILRILSWENSFSCDDRLGTETSNGQHVSDNLAARAVVGQLRVSTMS